MTRVRWTLALGVVALIGSSGGATAAPATDEVFERYRASVFSVVIIESSSGSRASYGSGFFVDAEGRGITNFHVVSQVVHEPGAYRAEIHQNGQVPRPLEVLAVDVVNDLAVVSDQRQPTLYLDLASQEPLQGTRLYSFGNPRDLGPAVVEGTFNGAVEASFYNRYHLTGAINPGMSGGPTIDADGRVVGINVAYMRGNLIGFLVPVAHARELLLQARVDQVDHVAHLREQLAKNQEALASWLLAHIESTSLGRYQLPKVDSPYMRCWGDRRARSFETYEQTRHGCDLESSLFVTSEHDTGGLSFSHTLLSTTELNRFQFYALYEREFASSAAPSRAGRDDVGSFTCHTDFVERDGLRLKVVLCLRAYKKLAGLYDAVLKAVTLDEDRAGLATELRLGGFAHEDVQRIASRYLEQIRWRP